MRFAAPDDSPTLKDKDSVCRFAKGASLAALLGALMWGGIAAAALLLVNGWHFQ